MQEQMVQQLMENAVLSAAQAMEDKLDEQIHAMENMDEDDLEKIRQKRVAEMKKLQEKKQEWMARGHGEYTELLTEKDFFPAAKGEERMVCHFYRENWPCKVMDKHLAILAKRHIETKFVKLNAEKSPYLTEKLQIWMLPTLALIQKGKVKDYIAGFDDMGGTDDFKTEILAAMLGSHNMINFDDTTDYGGGGLRTVVPSTGNTTIRKGGKPVYGESDEDSDFDDL